MPYCGTHDNENVAQTSCLQAGSLRYRIFVVNFFDLNDQR